MPRSSGKPLDLTTGETDSCNDEFPLDRGEAGAVAALPIRGSSAVSAVPPVSYAEFMARSREGVHIFSRAASSIVLRSMMTK